MPESVRARIIFEPVLHDPAVRTGEWPRAEHPGPDVDADETLKVVVVDAFNGRDLAAQGHARRPGLKVLFTSRHPLDLLDEERPGGSVPLLKKP